MKKLFFTSLLLCFVAFSYAQSIVVTSGSVDFMKELPVLDFSFSYNDMRVGKMTEAEYIDKKVTDYNEKEEGKGDEWEVAWIADRQNRFEPKFLELFDKVMSERGVSLGKEGAKYLIEVNTDFTEPGWNVGVMRQNASVDLTCRVVDIASGEEVATISIRNASANSFWGADFDAGYRIQESYAKAGREFAKFLVKKAKLKKI